MSCLRGAVIVLAAAGVAASGCNNDELGGSTETMATSSSTTGDPSATGSATAGETTTGTSGETTTTGETTTGGEDPDPLLTRVEKILAALDVAMYACPNRAWPNIEVQYRARQVLLGSVSENRAWVWNFQQGGGEPPVVTEGELDSLPPEWTSFFNINMLGGTLTLGVSLDATQEVNENTAMAGLNVWPDFATALVLHEAFHFLGPQDGWPGGASRTVAYPEPWEPRYLRAQLMRALLGQLLGGGADYAPAAHWWSRLQAEHAPEMAQARFYDRIEGSAEYTALIHSAVAELGCDAADEDLLDLAIDNLTGGMFLDLERYSAGREYYDLGVLGGLLLRRDGVPGWELEVRSATPPADQLLASVTPMPQADDPEVVAGAQAVVAERNAELAEEIEPMIAAMADPSFTRVVTTMQWVQGSFGVGGFYFLADEPGNPEVFLRFSAIFAPPGSPTIEVQDLTSMVGITTPCQISGSGAVVLTVPTAALEVTGDLATTKTPKLAFENLEVVAVDDGNGLPWLCPVAGGGAGKAPAPAPTLEIHPLRAPGTAPHEQRYIVRGHDAGGHGG